MTTHQPPPPPSKPVVPPAPRPVTAGRVRRREWAAALRWVRGTGDTYVDPCWLATTATRIEDGTLTPWADQPEPDEPVADVLAAFERGPHGVTAPPPPRVDASGVKLDEPSGQRTAAAAAQALDLCAGTPPPDPEPLCTAVNPDSPTGRCDAPIRSELCPYHGVAEPAPDRTGPILGRALLDVDGELLRQVGPDRWQDFAGAEYRRAEVEADGPAREVLLVDPAVAQVLEAAAEWREADRAELTAARTADTPDAGEAEWLASRQLATEEALAEAVDALGDTTRTEPTPEPARSCGCRTIAEHHRATEAMGNEGSVDWLAQEFSRAGQALDRLPAWAQPVVVAKSEPTPGPVATANLATASHGLAEVTARLRTALDAGQDVPDADLVPLAGTYREALAAARRDAELWEWAAGDMEARDRHAAADALEWAEGTHAPGRLLELAAEIRAGTRPVPGNPEPDGGGELPGITVTTGPPKLPATGYERCRWCGGTVASRAGRWEHLGDPCSWHPVEPCPHCEGSADPMSCPHHQASREAGR